jgi:Cu-Zn family superoxide dismutase
MPNFEVPKSGKTTVEVLNAMVTLSEGRGNSLLGPDGTALLVHAGADDYNSQPSGDAGDPIACGVIMSSEQK